MRIYNLSKKAGEDFLNSIWSISPSGSERKTPKTTDLKIAELDNPSLAIIFDKELKLYFVRLDKSVLFPSLKDEVVLPTLQSATVDIGAVRFVCNGANVMRPGIVSFSGDFKKGDYLVIKEASHSKAIAVGRVLENHEQAQMMTKGSAIENLHYVGDELWEALKSL